MRYILFASVIFSTLQLGACCKEGLDGRATVNATIMHHDSLVPGATVYVKFDSKEPAADISEYDAVFTADATTGTLSIDNLKCGDYFFFAKGHDHSIGQDVSGGVSYTIRHADRKSRISISIPVTE